MQRSLLIRRLCFVLVFITSVVLPIVTFACSRALWVNDAGVFVGRNMDWPNDLKTTIWISPRGTARSGGADVNALEWTSKYGTITARGHNVMTTDGMNEKGFAAHLFWLNETDFGTRDANIPGLSVVMWAQYYLDNFASVEEAVYFTEHNPPFQMEAFESIAGPVNLHLIIDDASGDSAIIEYTDGVPHVYHSRHYISATNSPTYDKQLLNLRQYSSFGGTKSLPGTTTSLDRFVRTAFYTSHLPTPTSRNEAVAEILSVMENNSAPFGNSSLDRQVSSHTVWRTVLFLNSDEPTYYYQSTTSGMNLMSMPLKNFNFAVGAPEYRLDPGKVAEAGEVTKRFKMLPPPEVLDALTITASNKTKFARAKQQLKTSLSALPRD